MSKMQEIEKLGQKLDQLAANAITHGKNLGYDAIQFANNCSEQKSLVVESKEFSLANSFDTSSFTIAVHNQNKKGTASINTDKQDALNQAMESAASLASFSVPDPNLVMADSRIAPKANRLEFMFDENLAKMELNELQESMAEILSVLTQDKRISLDRFEMGIEISRSALMNSLGVTQSEAQTIINWQWMGMAVDGDEVSGFDYDGGFSFEKASFLKKAKEEAKKFSDSLVKFLYPTSCPSYKGIVLLTPRAVSELLIENILYHASGRPVMDNKSKWVNEIGKKVVSEKINLMDAPHNRLFSGATSFDQDGIPTKDLSIIKDGILQTHLLDCYTAKKIGKSTTAMAGGPFGLKMLAGKESLKFLSQARNELLVVDRFSGNTDPILGDFSGVAKNSFLYRNGQEVGAVSETMIAGNFFDLIKQIIGVSQETMCLHGSTEVPWIAVDGISVTGN